MAFGLLSDLLGVERLGLGEVRRVFGSHRLGCRSLGVAFLVEGFGPSALGFEEESMGLVLGFGRPNGLNDRDGASREKSDQTQKRGGDERSMSTRELSQLIEGGDGSSRDRLVIEMASDVLGEVPGGRVAALSIFLESFGDDRFDVAFEPTREASEARGFFVEDLPSRCGKSRSLDFDRDLAAQELERDDAQRIDIRAPVERGRIELDLLGTHVVEGSQELAGSGLKASRPRLLRRVDFGDSEVQHFRLTMGIDEDVVRFQVPVDHSVDMSKVDDVRDLGHERQSVGDARGFIGRVIEESAAIDQLHREERNEVAVLLAGHPGLEDLGDSRMLEASEDLGLELKAADSSAASEARPEDLQRDRAIGLGLAGTVDDTHSALAQHALDEVGPDALGMGLRGPDQGYRSGRSEVGIAGIVRFGGVFSDVVPEQLEDFSKQSVIATTSALEVRFLLIDGEVAHLEEQCGDAVVVIGSHQGFPCRGGLMVA